MRWAISISGSEEGFEVEYGGYDYDEDYYRLYEFKVKSLADIKPTPGEMEEK